MEETVNTYVQMTHELQVTFNNYSPQAQACRIIPADYSTIFTEPEENNCFSIIAQVIIREIAFSFILFVSSSKTSRNRAVSVLKISASE